MTDKILCPGCGKEIVREYYTEAGWLSEEYWECECGCKKAWAFGVDMEEPNE